MGSGHVQHGVGGRLHRGRERPARAAVDWPTSGDVPLDDTGQLMVLQRPTITPGVLGPDRSDDRRPPRLRPDGRLDGKPPSGIDHVVVVHTGRRRGLAPGGAVHFADGVEAAMAKAQELVGDRTVEVAAGDVGYRCWPRGSSTR